MISVRRFRDGVGEIDDDRDVFCPIDAPVPDLTFFRPIKINKRLTLHPREPRS
jgi:hypothetical protein